MAQQRTWALALAACVIAASVAPCGAGGRAAALARIQAQAQAQTPPPPPAPPAPDVRDADIWKITRPNVLTDTDDVDMSDDKCNKYIVIFDVAARGNLAADVADIVTFSLLPGVVPLFKPDTLSVMSSDEGEDTGDMFDPEVSTCGPDDPSTYVRTKFRIVGSMKFGYQVAQLYANSTLASDVLSIPGVCASYSELVRAETKPHPRCRGSRPDPKVVVDTDSVATSGSTDSRATNVRNSLQWIWGRR